MAFNIACSPNGRDITDYSDQLGVGVAFDVTRLNVEEGPGEQGMNHTIDIHQYPVVEGGQAQTAWRNIQSLSEFEIDPFADPEPLSDIGGETVYESSSGIAITGTGSRNIATENPMDTERINNRATVFSAFHHVIIRLFALLERICNKFILLILLVMVLTYRQFRRCQCRISVLDKATNFLIQVGQLLPDNHISKILLLDELGNSFLCRFQRLGELSDVDKAVLYYNQAVLLAPDGSSIKPTFLTNLGFLYMRRFERLGELPDLNQAVACQVQAVQLTPDGHTNKAKFLNNLGTSHGHRFVRTGELLDLNNAITYQNQCVQLTPDGHVEKPTYLTNLGRSYMQLFIRLGELSDLNKAIVCQTQSVQLVPNGHINKTAILTNLAGSYICRFQRLGDSSDLNQAVDFSSQAVQLTPENHLARPKLLSDLGCAHLCRFKCFGSLTDVDKAIAYNSEAVQLTPDGYADKPVLLDALGSAYCDRFERLGEIPDLDKAINCRTQAVWLTPEDHAAKPRFLKHLGSTHFSRFQRLGKLSDVNNAVAHHTQANYLIPERHAAKPDFLDTLGSSHRARFEHFGELLDIYEAVTRQDQAVRLTPEDHAAKPMLLNSLGISYMSRFLQLGDLSDIDKAITYQSQANRLIPDGHACKAVHLNDLGRSCAYRFQSRGELTDIDNAIEYQLQAVQLIGNGHAAEPVLFSELAGSYLRRFERLRELSDIDEAIICQRHALNLTPDDHAIKSKSLSTLGFSYIRRFELLGSPSDIDEAVIAHSQAAELIPDGHANKPMLLNNLGLSYTCRSKNLLDINRGITCNDHAVKLSPAGHADTPLFVHNLASAYENRFMHLGQRSDIDKAIAYQMQAAGGVPDGHARKPLSLKSLGNLYLSRFQLAGETLDLEMANHTFQVASLLVTGYPIVRFKAAHEWAKSCALLGFSPKAAYQRAMVLVPQLVWLGTTIGRRYDVLTQIGNIATEAAASAISEMDFDQALEWLEEGRSIVWNQILQLRMPLDTLSTIDPSLARRLEDVGSELERAGSRPMSDTRSANRVANLEQEAQRHRRLATEWDRQLEQARNITGFEDFLRPPKAEALISAAKDGPIILINIHASRCDALVILPNVDNVAHVPLPNFSVEMAVNAGAQLQSLVGQRSPRTRWLRLVTRNPSPRDKFKNMLKTLWLHVVKPVFDFLQYTEPSEGSLPHVTWCTTGPLSFLPLHAAGCYDGIQPNAFDLVVSSYTPTLSALLSSTSPNCSSGILAVGQEHTEGLSALPNTRRELKVIEEIAEDISHLLLDDERATVDTVLKAMDKYSWVHLACHASQNASDPSKSAFHLHDGSLMLSAITKRSFKNKGLAFLSACQTAAGDEKLPDEAVHLAAGMLMAGYPSVIATMWVIADEDAPEIARAVYAELIKEGRMDCSGAARALHKAVAGLREKVGEEAFERWVPFMHIGR